MHRAIPWEEKIGNTELVIIIKNSMHLEIFPWKLWYVIEKERSYKKTI